MYWNFNNYSKSPIRQPFINPKVPSVLRERLNFFLFTATELCYGYHTYFIIYFRNYSMHLSTSAAYDTAKTL